MNGIQINLEDRLSITEKWHEKSRIRLLKLMKKYPNSILVTGDVHYAEILEVTCNGYSLLELTTSGLTHSVETTYGLLTMIFVEFWYPYTHNISPRIYQMNFGSIKIEDNGDISLKVLDSFGKELLRHDTSLNYIKTGNISKNYLCEQSVGQRQIRHLASIGLVFFLPFLAWLNIFLIFLRKYSHSF